MMKFQLLLDICTGILWWRQAQQINPTNQVTEESTIGELVQCLTLPLFLICLRLTVLTFFEKGEGLHGTGLQ